LPRLPRPRRIRLGSGIEIALLDWGGEGPLVLMHHANGFCAGTLGLVAEGLVADHHVVGMDARGHGDSSKPQDPEVYRWDRFAEDLLGVAEVLAGERADGCVAVGLGHSFGGTSVLGAAARRPELFGRLVLVDPVIPTPPEMASVYDPERRERLSRMVEKAQGRRSLWASRADARAHFAERSLFADWLPEAIDLYVEHALRDRDDGQVELKCPGEIEGAIFAASGGLDVFDLARRARVPATVLWATRGDFPRAVYERVFAVMANARIVDCDVGHLIPMERPELVVGAVRAREPATEERKWASSRT
jgi:pimeloyl-ACP methyl ester carboxylesterase